MCIGIQPRCSAPSISAREGGSRSNSFHFFVTAISRSFLVCMPQRRNITGRWLNSSFTLSTLFCSLLLSFAASIPHPPPAPFHEHGSTRWWWWWWCPGFSYSRDRNSVFSLSFLSFIFPSFSSFLPLFLGFSFA